MVQGISFTSLTLAWAHRWGCRALLAFLETMLVRPVVWADELCVVRFETRAAECDERPTRPGANVLRVPCCCCQEMEVSAASATKSVCMRGTGRMATFCLGFFCLFMHDFGERVVVRG